MKRWVAVLLVLFVALAPQASGYAPGSALLLPESSFDPVWNLADASGYSFCGGDPVNRFDADGRVGKAVGQFAADTSSSLGQLVCDAYYSIGYALVYPVSAQSAQRWYGGSAQRFAGTVAGTAQMIYDVAALASYGLFSPFAPEEAYNAYGGAIERLEQRLPVFYGGSGQSAAVTRPEPCLPTASEAQIQSPAPKQPVALLPEAAESAGSAGRVFWSGRQGANRAAAEAFAQSTGRTTLEMTPAGQALEAAGGNISQWRELSADFARGASGEVYAFVGGSRVNSVWYTVEKPILMQNPNVQKIIILDATQPWKSTIIYK